jgi:hypothetical protein
MLRTSFKTSLSRQRDLVLVLTVGTGGVLQEVGVPVATRTTPTPRPDPAQHRALKAKMEALASKYETELLKPEGTKL